MASTALHRPPLAEPAPPSWIHPLAFPRLHGRKLTVQLVAGNARLGGIDRASLAELASQLRLHPDLAVRTDAAPTAASCDLLHCFGADPGLLVRGRWGERRRLCTVDFEGAWPLGPLGDWAAAAFIRLLCHRVDGVIATSTSAAERLRNAGLRVPLRTLASGQSRDATLAALSQVYDLAARGCLAGPPPDAPRRFRLLEWPLGRPKGSEGSPTARPHCRRMTRTPLPKSAT